MDGDLKYHETMRNRVAVQGWSQVVLYPALRPRSTITYRITYLCGWKDLIVPLAVKSISANTNVG
jgi:hypothetical protein